MKQICLLLALAAIFGTAFHALAEGTKMEKTWSFQGSGGVVEIKLIRFPDKKGPTSLNIYSPDGAHRSVTEEAEFLTTVLDSLPKEGIRVESLDLVNVRLQEKEAISRVATCAALSERWRTALKTRSIPSVYPLVTSFLNDCGAYKEWDAVFRLHGLTLRVAGVEEVIMQPFSRTHAICPKDEDCRNLLVPRDAAIQMNVGNLGKPGGNLGTDGTFSSFSNLRRAAKP